MPLAGLACRFWQLALNIHSLCPLGKGGVWARVAEALSDEADLEELFIDATIVRAHQHAAGAPKKTVAIRRSVDRAVD
jgi:hypothetical protein